jgi:hypothetical protein
LDEWSYRKQLVVPRRTPSAELRNFPLLVSLPRDDDLRDRARNDGGDILFALPDGTLLAHETESFAGDTGRLVAWVKIPTLDTSAVTVLYLYYGNGEADIESRSSSVWNDFTGVWHLSETGSGARGEYRDATGNGHNGTGGGGVGRAVPTSAPGIVGQGQSGDGVDDIITTSASINGLGQVTISLWARLRRVDNIHRPGLAGQNDAIEIGFYWSDRLNMWTEGMTTPCPGKQVASLCTDVPTMEEWFHLAVTWDGSDATMYVNGVEEHSLGALPRSSVYTFNLMGAVFDPSGNHLDGLLDEVRLADTVRSAAWVAHEYANQVAPTSFCQVGEEESL